MASSLYNKNGQSDMKLKSMADDSHAERLAAAIEEFHESAWTELNYIADWWNIPVEELMIATSGPTTDDPPEQYPYYRPSPRKRTPTP
jgi:hypothetical protein